MIPPTALVLAPVRSLGLVLAGCPDCRAMLGIHGAPGLAAALAAHRAACPATAQVCPGCGCEAELHPYGDTWRCGDCLGERLFDRPDLDGAGTSARRWLRGVPARQHRSEHHHPAAGAEPAEEAVA